MDNQRVNYLEKEEFNKFYRDVTKVLLDAKSNPRKGDVSLEQLMKKANLVFDIEPSVHKEIKPALSGNLYAPTQEAGNGCAACSICAVCALCGELNGASGVIGLAGLIGFASSQYQISQQ